MLTRNSIEKKYKDANLKSLERVAFDACEVLEVDESTFQPFKTLKSIYLANNRLRSISRRLFRGLKSLEDIDLSQNELEAIHPRTFIDQANLTRLSLYFNQIQEVWNLFELFVRVINLNNSISTPFCLKTSLDMRIYYASINNMSLNVAFLINWTVYSYSILLKNCY